MREYHYAIILRRKRFRSSCSAKVGTRAPPQKKEEKRKNSTKGEGGGGGVRRQEKRDFLFTPPSPGLFFALVPAFSNNWHGNACYVSY